MLPTAYLYNEYDGFFQTRTGFVMIPVLLSGFLLTRFTMHRLKTVADTGVALDKEIAREIRFVIPLLIAIALLEVIHYNVGGITEVLSVIVLSNVIATPLRLAAYRTSKRYDRDVASLKMYEDFQKKQKL